MEILIKAPFYDWEELQEIFPISRQTWMKEVKKKRYPPAYLGKNNKNVWKKDDIHRLIARIVIGEYESMDTRWDDSNKNT